MVEFYNVAKAAVLLLSLPVAANAASLFDADFSKDLKITIAATNWTSGPCCTLESVPEGQPFFDQAFSFSFVTEGLFTRYDDSYDSIDYQLFAAAGEISDFDYSLASGPIDILSPVGLTATLLASTSGHFLNFGETYYQGVPQRSGEYGNQIVYSDGTTGVVYPMLEFENPETQYTQNFWVTDLVEDGELVIDTSSLSYPMIAQYQLGEGGFPPVWLASDMTVTIEFVTAVPLPAGAVLGLTGLAALAGVRLRGRRT